MDVFTLGESMLRFSPPDHQRIESAAQFDVFVGGAESNVAVALARLGKQVAWFSRLPHNPLGHQLANTLRLHGVHIDHVVWAQGERLGLYFVEQGSPPRSTRVWYDRANSAASRMTPNDLPVEPIKAARWLHLTGITPALSPSCRETAAAALELGRSAGLTISFDVNYRSLLWTPHEAAAALEPFCKAADVVFVAERDAQNLFGTDDVRALQQRWGGKIICSQGDAGVIGDDGQDQVNCLAFQVEVVDRVGAGDALAAGVICGLLEGASMAEALRFGAAAAALKLTIPGDLALVSREEVEALLRDQSGRVMR